MNFFLLKRAEAARRAQKHANCLTPSNEPHMQKCAATCTFGAALIGLIDLRVPGLKVVVITGLLVGNLCCTLTLIRHVRLIRGSHYEGGHC